MNTVLPNHRIIKARAVYYLSKRDYSRSELTKKLATAIYIKNDSLENTDLTASLRHPTIEEINEVLDDLHKQGFLNDARFASSTVKRQAVKYGAARISFVLSQHQLDTDTVSDLIQELKDTELQRCYTVWLKRFDGYGVDVLRLLSYPDRQVALGKQGRFLTQRGFNADVIRKVLQGWQPDTL
ncbi:MAG: hypothetical protein RI956_254 [Pseudomonadota bacterium]|jgi:regulatory protein